MKALVKFKETERTKDRLLVIPDKPIVVTLVTRYYHSCGNQFIIQRKNNSHLQWNPEDYKVMREGVEFEILLMKEK